MPVLLDNFGGLVSKAEITTDFDGANGPWALVGSLLRARIGVLYGGSTDRLRQVLRFFTIF